MEKPNYRLSIEREQGEARILTGFSFRNKGKSIEEKTFSFLFGCNCDSESESRSYICDCNIECNCNSECRHCRCVDHKKPCRCNDNCGCYDKCSCERVTCDGHDSNSDDCIPYESHRCTDSEPSDNCCHGG